MAAVAAGDPSSTAVIAVLDVQAGIVRHLVGCVVQVTGEVATLVGGVVGGAGVGRRRAVHFNIAIEVITPLRGIGAIEKNVVAVDRRDLAGIGNILRGAMTGSADLVVADNRDITLYADQVVDLGG